MKRSKDILLKQMKDREHLTKILEDINVGDTVSVIGMKKALVANRISSYNERFPSGLKKRFSYPTVTQEEKNNMIVKIFRRQ